MRRQRVGNVCGVTWIVAFAKLPLIVEVNEQVNGSMQGINATTKTAALANQSGQVVPEVSVCAFHRIGLRFVMHHRCVVPSRTGRRKS
jgi:hypothetical protein